MGCPSYCSKILSVLLRSHFHIVTICGRLLDNQCPKRRLFGTWCSAAFRLRSRAPVSPSSVLRANDRALGKSEDPLSGQKTPILVAALKGCEIRDMEWIL